MKWLRYLVLLFLLASDLAAVEYFYVNGWGGVNTFFDSAKIRNEDAQFAINVLTDRGYLEKRPGNVRLTQILSGFPVRYLEEFIPPDGSNRYILSHTSSTVYYFSNTLSSGVVVIATTSANFEIDTAKLFNRIYVTNTFDQVWSWNKDTVTWWPTFPKCKIIEGAYERMFCANYSGNLSAVTISSYGSTSDWTVPAIAPLPADAPNILFFRKDDGDTIQCMKQTPWGVFVGKRRSSWVIKGTNNDDFSVRMVDSEIGCISDRSVQLSEGILKFASLDGLYEWDGAGPLVKISEEIEPTYLSIRQLNTFDGLALYSSQADWESAGSSRPENGGRTQFITNNPEGSLVANKVTGAWFESDFQGVTFDQVTTSTLLYPSGSFGLDISTAGFVNSGFEQMGFGQRGTDNIKAIGSTANWTVTDADDDTVWIATDAASFNFSGTRGVVHDHCESSGGGGCSGGIDKIKVEVLSANDNTVLFSSVSTAQNGENDLLTINTASLGVGSNIYLKIYRGVCSSQSQSTRFLKSNVFQRGQVVKVKTSFKSGTGVGCVNGNFGKTFLDMTEGITLFSSGTWTGNITNTDFNYPVWGTGTYTAQFSTAGSIYMFTQTSQDGVVFADTGTFVDSGVVNQPGGKIKSLQYRYIRPIMVLEGSNNTSNRTSPVITDISFGATSTGAYTSRCIFTSSGISSWKQIDFSGVFDPSNRAQFQVRSSSWCIPATNNTVLWTNQTNHQEVAVATNAYIQFRASSTILSTTETWTMSEVSIQWNDGLEKPMASAVKNGRYYLSVTTQSGSSNNDLVLVEQKHGKWTFFGGPRYYSMGIYDNNIVAGDASNDSYIWKTMQKDIYNDDGVPITSVWISKDFILDLPNNNKSLQETWVEAMSVQGSSVTISVTSDKSDSYKDKTLNLYVNRNFVNRRIPVEDGYIYGKYLRMKISNMDLDNYFRLNAYTLGYELLPLRGNDD